MRNYVFIITIFLFASNFVFSQSKTLHNFKAKDIDGKDFNFSQLKGKKIILVNTASKASYTPQYEKLEEIYRKYNKKLVVVAFPSNDFLKQEPESNKKIKSFCKREFGVTFPIMSKISVKGEEIHPIYKWLTQKSENGVLDTKIRWSFQKFLIDEKGHLVKKVNPSTSPDDEEIINWIEGKSF